MRALLLLMLFVGCGDASDSDLSTVTSVYQRTKFEINSETGEITEARRPVMRVAVFHGDVMVSIIEY